LKVVSSSFSTFHMFDQARQLARLGLLHRFFSGPPAYFARKKGLDVQGYEALWPSFALGQIGQRLSGGLPEQARQALTQLTHNSFSRALAGRLPPDMDLFIGLSSFCLEAVQAARALGVPAIVDHGSLHEKFELEQVEMEREAFGFQVVGNSAQHWLIDKEDREFQAADHVMVLSQCAKRSMVSHGVDEAKIFVNPCGVSLTRFQPATKRDDVFRVIFCGQVNPRKGIHYLIRAFRELKLPKAEMWVIGSLDVAERDPKFARFLRDHQDDAIHFKGTVPGDDLAALFNQGSVLVLPSVADGFGMVVSQAMSCGLPVVVSSHAGAADLVTDGVNGFVVPARDVAALQDRLLRLYRSPELARDMGAQARHTVTSGQSWDDYGDRLAAFLHQVHASRHAPRA